MSVQKTVKPWLFSFFHKCSFLRLPPVIVMFYCNLLLCIFIIIQIFEFVNLYFELFLNWSIEMIDRLEELCIKNGISLTALCKEITGSSGNLPTWKKNRIRSDWLQAICIKFNISSDYLLGLSSDVNLKVSLSKEEQDVLNRFNRLTEDFRIKAQSYMIDLYEKQKANKNFIEDLENWVNTDKSVAADEPLKKTGTTNQGK